MAEKLCYLIYFAAVAEIVIDCAYNYKRSLGDLSTPNTDLKGLVSTVYLWE